MEFQQKYNITQMFLPAYTKRRPGSKIKKVAFIVAHDTGNKNSTARQNVQYYINSANEISASAHIFVDDKEILECIPTFQTHPEKAWHVNYDKPYDNELYGIDANDGAMGVEYCYGDKINADEAYKRYVWVLAYLCYYFNLNPKTSIVGHMILDPQRRIDPKNGLSYSGRTYEQLLQDVIFEYKRCLNMFIDVPEGHYSEEAIYRLKKNGIIVGFEDGSFGFGKSLTREDFAVIIDRILQKQCWYKE